LLDEHPDDFAERLRALELDHHFGERFGEFVLFLGREDPLDQLHVDERHFGYLLLRDRLPVRRCRAVPRAPRLLPRAACESQRERRSAWRPRSASTRRVGSSGPRARTTTPFALASRGSCGLAAATWLTSASARSCGTRPPNTGA